MEENVPVTATKMKLAGTGFLVGGGLAGLLQSFGLTAAVADPIVNAINALLPLITLTGKLDVDTVNLLLGAGLTFITTCVAVYYGPANKPKV